MVRQNKKLGQVFLHDHNILRKIVAAAELTPDEPVVEIGCGDGALSSYLVQIASHLTIIEIDPRCLEITQSKLSDYSSVRYVLGDVLEVGFKDISGPSFKVVANIPYYISAPIIKLLAQNRSRVSDATLMVQKEFALKLVGKPGDKHYTPLTLWTQYHFEVDYSFTVSKNCFFPVPKVDSAVVRLRPKSSQPDVEEDVLFAVIRSAFWARRKTLANCLANSPYLTLDPDYGAIPFLQQWGAVRGETLTFAQFLDLYTQLRPFVGNTSFEPVS